MWLPGSHVLDRAGIRDSREQGLRYLAALVGPDQDGVDRGRMEAFVRDSPAFARFLDDQGLALRHASGWSDYYAERPGGIDAGRTLYCAAFDLRELGERSEEHTSELQSLMRISYAVFCLKQKNKPHNQDITN